LTIAEPSASHPQAARPAKSITKPAAATAAATAAWQNTSQLALRQQSLSLLGKAIAANVLAPSVTCGEVSTLASVLGSANQPIVAMLSASPQKDTNDANNQSSLETPQVK